VGRRGTPVDAGWLNRDRPRRAGPSSELGPTVYDELIHAGTISEWKPSLVDRLHHVRLLFERCEEEHGNFETAQPVRQPNTGYVCSFRWMQQ